MSGPGSLSVPPAVEVMPKGGLSARLRVLASALVVAESQQAPLTVVWTAEHNTFAAPTSLLFDLTALPYWATVIDLFTLPDSLWDTARQIDRPDQFPYYLQTLGWRRPIRVKSSAPLANSYTDALRLIRPSAELVALRTSIFSQVVGKTLIGVHLRASGSPETAYYSPPAVFWNAMTTILAINPDTLFYVASDTQGERDEAIRRFPGQVLLGFATLLGRNDPYGSVQDAVDFFCLAECSKILGSYGSGFGELAAEYAGIPFEVMSRSP